MLDLQNNIKSSQVCGPQPCELCFFPPGVPADLKSAVKKVRPIKTGGFAIPQQQPQKVQTGCCGLQIRRTPNGKGQGSLAAKRRINSESALSSVHFLTKIAL